MPRIAPGNFPEPAGGHPASPGREPGDMQHKTINQKGKQHMKHSISFDSLGFIRIGGYHG